jgi:hypothetical protein
MVIMERCVERNRSGFRSAKAATSESGKASTEKTATSKPRSVEAILPKKSASADGT